jgi:hypothetical protein
MTTVAPACDRLARALAAQVEMRRRAVDLERRAGLGRGRVDGGVVHVVARPAPDELVGGWVITDTSGWRIAARHRRVSCGASWPAESWSEASTMSSDSSTASGSRARRRA